MSTLEELALNQATGRIANERMTAWPERQESTGGEALVFFCECGNARCREPMDLTRSQYEAVRVDSRHFPVAPGHVYTSVERVIEAHDSYVVVEKFEPVAETVTATDPRS